MEFADIPIDRALLWTLMTPEGWLTTAFCDIRKSRNPC